MDRRRQPRFSAHQEARITLLGDQPLELEGRLENLSQRGARLLLGRPLPLNAAVQVDLRDSVLLGEVCYVQPESGKFAVGLALDQVFRRMPELVPLIEALRSETGSPVAPATANEHLVTDGETVAETGAGPERP